MNWFIKRFKNKKAEYLGKNGSWVNPVLVRSDSLVILDYASAKKICSEFKKMDSSICFVNGIKEKLDLVQNEKH